MALKTILEKVFIDKNFKEEVKFLQRVPLFSGLSDKSIGRILGIANQKRYDKNEIVFDEGTIGNVLYIIKSGKVMGIKGDRIVFELFAGEYFGELALLEETPRVVTVKASEETELLLIYKVKFDGYLQDDPAAGVRILKNFIKKFAIILNTDR